MIQEFLCDEESVGGFDKSKSNLRWELEFVFVYFQALDL